jgi:hypothetical protein
MNIWRICWFFTHTNTVGPRFTNVPVHEQIFRAKTSRMTNGVSDYEHVSLQQRQAESISAGVSCWLTMAQYTSLLDFGLRTFRFTNISVHERPPGTD